MDDLLKLDLSNPEEVVNRMPELERIHDEKVEERDLLNGQISLLSRLIAAFKVTGGPVESGLGEPESTRRKRVAPAQERAVRALEQAPFPMSPRSLYKFMVEKGLDAPKDSSLLGVNLYDAWKAKRVMRAPNGVYAPLDGTGKTDIDRPLADYQYAGEHGFPTP
jgi:hypothetical protein